MGLKKLPISFRKVLNWLKWGVLLFFGLSILSTIIFAFIPVPFTPLMGIRATQQFIDSKEVELHKQWVPIEKISPHLQLAVVCAEDQKYLDHFGFDVDAIKKALDHNKESKRVRGASTISQQTAKNLFLWPGRSWIRKGLEVYFTLLIEVFWSKERILEVYLNVAEMGNGVYGAEAASLYYFGKPSDKISRQQAALLAACLPNPRKYSPVKPSRYISGRQNWILRQMRYWGSSPLFDEKKD